ncbi:hypothetical protein QYM36_016326, partial [Artemia franciscana]
MRRVRIENIKNWTKDRDRINFEGRKCIVRFDEDEVKEVSEDTEEKDEEGTEEDQSNSRL